RYPLLADIESPVVLIQKTIFQRNARVEPPITGLHRRQHFALPPPFIFDQQTKGIAAVAQEHRPDTFVQALIMKILYDTDDMFLLAPERHRFAYGILESHKRDGRFIKND